MKDNIRKNLKSIRASFSGERRDKADKAISELFINLFGDYESYFIYNSFGTEADTKLIMNALLKAGKKVYLPRVEGEDIIAVPFGKLTSGAFGIEEPVGQAFSGRIDVTVIPLLAVNSGLYRIGYGKGFYDRYLKDKNTIKVGLGYFFQMCEFKEDEWDIPLDAFICEKGIYSK